jgi:hypothetical protein
MLDALKRLFSRKPKASIIQPAPKPTPARATACQVCGAREAFSVSRGLCFSHAYSSIRNPSNARRRKRQRAE